MHRVERAPENRIARRSTATIKLNWTVERKARFRMKEISESVQVVSVSVAGIGLIAPTAPGLAAGSIVPIFYDRFAGLILIRRITPTDDPAISYYGAELVNPGRDLSEALLGHVPEAHGVSLEDVWNRSS